MSIWTIEETQKAICFIEQVESSYQAYDIIKQMSLDYRNSPVQIPVIAGWNGYENCLAWNKNWQPGQR